MNADNNMACTVTLERILRGLVPSSFITAVSPFGWNKEYFVASLAGARLNVVGELSDEQPIPAAIFKTVIPVTNSKSKKAQSIPLNDIAIDVLDQLDTEGKHEYPFINRKTGKPYTTIHKAWTRLTLQRHLVTMIKELSHVYRVKQFLWLISEVLWNVGEVEVVPITLTQGIDLVEVANTLGPDERLDGA